MYVRKNKYFPPTEQERRSPCGIVALLLVLYVVLMPFAAEASGAGGRTFIRGIVRDSLTTAGIPYASVVLVGPNTGVVADERGIFEMSVTDIRSRSIKVSCVGYESKVVPLGTNSFNLYDVSLSALPTELKEVVVGRSKYSKKNNPALDFARRLRDRSSLTDPRAKHDYYSYDKYERISLGLNDFDPSDDNNAMLRKFAFLKEHVDTSEVSGKPVLNVSVKEKNSRVFFRRSPRSEKEDVVAYRSVGVDEIATQENVRTLLEDMLREVDLYGDDIELLGNRFVSPLSRLAPDFYKFYLVDTVAVDGDSCVALAFYPHNKASFGFNGHVYVPVGDSTMFIRRVEMSVPRDINLNFIENMHISQDFSRAPDGSRLKNFDDLMLEIKVMPGTPGLYTRRSLAFTGHDFKQPADTSIFSFGGKERMSAIALDRDDDYWKTSRTIAMSRGEDRTSLLLQRLRSVPLYYWSEKVLKILFSGYVRTGGADSRFDIGPVNTFASYNGLEGLRLRFGGMTTANLSPRWFAKAYGAYGFRDHKWKYGAEVEYSFHDKLYHAREFPVHSLRLTHSYDVDRPGQHYLFTNADNFVLSLKRMSDRRDTYRRLTKLDYTLELHNNFSLVASVANTRQEATHYLPFIDGYGNSIGHFTENTVALQLRYAPGEKFYQTKSTRVPVNLEAPVFVLTHTYSPAGKLGSRFGINKTEMNISKRFWLSVFGYVDAFVGGGHVWGKSCFLDLFIPNANLSYTIQPQSFALMDPMEFVNSSYVSWDVTYWLNGALLNLVPGVKKLKLREVVGFRGLYGGLNRRNTPGEENPELLVFPLNADTRKMDQGPYMEISAGLDNILRCIRVDYVWRLSYRRTPYPIDHSGVRVALHFTF